MAADDQNGRFTRPTKDPRVACAHPTDVHVGARVRARRKALGISQTQLAATLGLTFQQVQKYERGSNRISASKLKECADALDVSIVYFFEGLPSGNGGGGSVGKTPEQLAADAEALAWLEGIKPMTARMRRDQRRVLKGLIEVMVTTGPEA